MRRFANEQQTQILKTYYQKQEEIILTQRAHRSHYIVKSSLRQSMIRHFEKEDLASDLQERIGLDQLVTKPQFSISCSVS